MLIAHIPGMCEIQVEVYFEFVNDIIGPKRMVIQHTSHPHLLVTIV